MKHKRWVLVVLIMSLSGCVTHAVTSGRFVVRDTHGAGPAPVAEVRFNDDDRQRVQDYYRNKKSGGKHKKTPPGLAKRDTLPPGLQGRNLPSELEARLAPLPSSYVRVIVGGDIVLMNSRTRVVVDILSDVVID